MSIIDDGRLRGFIVPVEFMNKERFNLIMEDIEDTDPKFLSEIHEEYKKSKKNNSLISVNKIKKRLGI